MTIPGGWTLTNVGELTASFRSGDAFLKLEYTDDGVPVLAKGDIKPFGRMEHSEKRFLEASIAETRGYTLTEPDDLLVTTRDLTQKADVLGLASPVPQDQPYLVNQGANLLRLKNPALNRYFVYWTNGPIYREFMKANFVGSTQIHIRHGDVMRAPVWLPPDDERIAIVEVLGALDDKIEQNRRTGRSLEAFARATFKAWFVNFAPVKAKAAGRPSFPGMTPADFATLPDRLTDSPLGPVPHGWGVGRLGDLLSERGERITPGEESRRLPYVPIDCITSKRVTLETFKSGEEAQSSLIRFRSGDILFGAMRPYFHKVCLAPFGGTTRTTCFVLTPRKDSDTSFALMLASEDATVQFATTTSVGSTIPYAKWKNSLSEMPCVVPPAGLRAAYEEVAKPMLQLSNQGVGESAKLAALRDYLLPRLLSGTARVRPSEAEVDA